MSVSRIQDFIGTNSGAVASLAKPYGSNVTAGSLLIATVAAWDSTSDTITIAMADNNGNTWVAAEGPVRQDQPSTHSVAYIYYAKNANAGATTVTATPSATPGNAIALYIAEYGGVDTTSPLDGHNFTTYSGSFDTAASAGNITTSTAGMWVAYNSGNNGAPAVGTVPASDHLGFANAPFWYHGGEDAGASGTSEAAGTYNMNFATAAFEGSGWVLAAAFKEASGGGTVLASRLMLLGVGA